LALVGKSLKKGGKRRVVCNREDRGTGKKGGLWLLGGGGKLGVVPNKEAARKNNMEGEGG